MDIGTAATIGINARMENPSAAGLRITRNADKADENGRP
jgi:hypothetical protein